MAITKWQEKYDRAKAALATFRERTQGVAVQARYTGEAVIAGALAGGLRGAVEASGKEYAIPTPGGGPKVPPELPIGGLLLAVAMSKPKAPSASDFHAAGTGILAFLGGREAENFMRKRGSLTPGAVQ